MNTFGLCLEQSMMSASNIVEPILLIQTCFLYLFPNFLKGTMIGAPVKFTTALILFGIPRCTRSDFKYKLFHNNTNNLVDSYFY